MGEEDVPRTETIMTAPPVLACPVCFCAVAGAPGAIVSNIWRPRGDGVLVRVGLSCRVPMGGHRPDALAVLPFADRAARAAPCGICSRTPCRPPEVA